MAVRKAERTMIRSTIDPATEGEPVRRDGRVSARVSDAVVWAGTAFLVAAVGCAVGLAAGQRLPVVIWFDIVLNGGVVETAFVMTALGGIYGLVAGGLVGLLRGRPNRIAAGLKGGLGFAVFGAVAGGLGPLLSSRAEGQLPAAGSAVVVCATVGSIAGLVGCMGRRAMKPAEPPDDWVADPDLVDRRREIGRSIESGAVARQWPILAVSTGCLVVAVVTPPSPAGWPMLAVGLLGFAVAWVLAGQDRRLRAVEEKLRARPDVAGPGRDGLG